MPRPSRYLALAQAIDPERAAACGARLAEALPRGSTAHALATLLSAGYPALASVLEASPDIARRLAEEGFVAARYHPDFLARTLSRVGDLGDAEHVRRELRLVARAERVRIALRELLPPSLGGADVDVTARELADLASATIEVALAEAVYAISRRFGEARAASGARGRFTVLGMGKLGGEELNAGSDVDLVYFYDTDEGGVGGGPAVEGGGASSITLHDYWTRVARRLTATLEEPTEDGFVWRVDLRLRPEGRSGPLVNSLAAAERYYESFGRLWERAALLRARPVAGDQSFGAEVLATLSPFIWRRRVDPRLSGEMIGLAQRSRAELGPAPRATSSSGRAASARPSSSCRRSSSSGEGRSRACGRRARSTGSGACAPRASSPTARRGRSPRGTWPSAARSTPCRSPPASRRTRSRTTRRCLPASPACSASTAPPPSRPTSTAT